MFEALKGRILHWARVPHDPEPPAGAPGSEKVFRAGKNFFYVRLLSWAVAQLGAVIGIFFSIGLIAKLETDYEAALATKAQRQRAAAVAAAQPPAPPATTPPAPAVAGTETTAEPKKKARRNRPPRDSYNRIVERAPWWVIPLIKLFELGGIVLFVAQLPVTFAIARLDWELRWYIVTDRSLRIRAGIMSLQESTMSFANLQQVEVMQGPVQRLLGIADVRVRSAGGGGDMEQHGHGGHGSLHTGIFHGVDNAHEIRDLILERLRRFREAGLGDPDEHPVPVGEAPSAPAALPAPSDALAAALELLTEARALRQALS